MTDTPELPPLPEPVAQVAMSSGSPYDARPYPCGPAGPQWVNAYTATQLRAYAAEAVRVARQQAREQALEDASWLLDDAAKRLLAPKRVNQVDRHTADILQTKAASIRALVGLT